jgi:ABC-type nitrate/sulfonate/bicarbonate transport system permease component
MGGSVAGRVLSELWGFICFSLGSVMTREFLRIVLPIAVIWEIFPRTGMVSSALIPPLSDVFLSFINLLVHRQLATHLLSSILSFTAGLFLAAAVAVPAGIAMGWNRTIRNHALPFFQILSPIPPTAWIPITVVVFGIGLPMKIFLIFIGSVYPILFNTYQAVKDTDHRYLLSARSFGAGEFTIIVHVYIRRNLGAIFMSIRTGVIMGLVMLAAAEMYGGRRGISFLLVQAKEFFQISEMMVCMGILGALGWLYSEIFRYGENKLTRWKQNGHD